jgi:uncharacterized phage protein gp47/JayE
MNGINYQPPTYKELFESYIRNAAANQLINDDPEYIQNLLVGKEIENILVMEFAIHAEILTETYHNLTKIYQSQNIDTAQGSDLDQLLYPYIPRRQETRAQTSIDFQKDTKHIEEIEIPRGTEITSTKYPEIIFQTIGTLTIPFDQSIGSVEAVCTTPGPYGNIPANKLNQLINPIEGITNVYNTYKATGGRHREDDTSYRLRGYEWTSINNHGTYPAIKNLLEELEIVENYHIQPLWDGPGTTQILIDPPTSETIKTVTKRLKEVKAVHEKYTIKGVDQKPINIDIHLQFDINYSILPLSDIEKENIKEDVKKVLQTYIEGGINSQGQKIKGLGLGTPFLPGRASAYILNEIPILQDIKITHPPSIVEIKTHQKASMGEIQCHL